MNQNPIFANIAKHVNLSSQETTQLEKNLSYQNVERKEIVLSEGNNCPYIYYVIDGALRAYVVVSKGKDSTIMIAVKDWWITDMHCFLNCLPSQVFIQAMEDSSLIRISKNDLDEIFDLIPQFDKFFRILMQNAYCREQLRTIQNLSLTAVERYNNFINKYPQFTSRVPQKHIASYLGITPEFLSSIKSKQDSENS